MHASSTTAVSAPVEHVWSILSDHEGMSAWAPGLKVRLEEEGAEERNGVGAVRRIDLPGPLPAIVEEITEFEPDVRLGYRAVSGVPLRNYRGDVELKRLGSGTEIVYTVSADHRLPLPVAEQVAVKAVSLALLTALVRRVRATA